MVRTIFMKLHIFQPGRAVPIIAPLFCIKFFISVGAKGGQTVAKEPRPNSDPALAKQSHYRYGIHSTPTGLLCRRSFRGRISLRQPDVAPQAP